MEVQNISSSTVTSCNNNEGEVETGEVPLPGFRFHPTEEELVGFYLKRKVEKKPLSVEIIKQADIYKYDPWDLPKCSINVGDKEWYFFCQRGRKYRNSIRPNRVTGSGSGFWKATGIDRPIYSSSGGDSIIGLKKSLVYYRGSAGKGTKTDWMMHEFRLPAPHDKTAKHFDHAKTLVATAHEAEIWTLCRIFKRNISYRKCVPGWWSESNPKRTAALDSSSKTCSSSSSLSSSNQQSSSSSYISFNNNNSSSSKPYSAGVIASLHHHHVPGDHLRFVQAPCAAAAAAMCGDDVSEFLRRGGDWEDLRSVVDAVTDVSATANPFYL